MKVWTDGSALSNPRGAMGWAWVDDKGAHDSGGARLGTNQIGELTGVLMALKAHPTGSLTIITDSQYVVNVFTKWSKGWQRKDWTLRDGSKVKNLPLIRTIRSILDTRKDKVQFQWTKGHSRSRGNNRADELANGYANKVKDGDTPDRVPPECVKTLQESEVVQTGKTEHRRKRGLYHRPGDSKHGHWRMIDGNHYHNGRRK